MSDYYILSAEHTDSARIKREREKARLLKKTSWWHNKLAQGLCHYCGNKFTKAELTLDHVVPLARGGTSSKGNLVPSCKLCNTNKKLETPVEQLLKQLESKRS